MSTMGSQITSFTTPRVIGLCEFHTHGASNADNVCIWWRRHGFGVYITTHVFAQIDRNYCGLDPNDFPKSFWVALSDLGQSWVDPSANEEALDNRNALITRIDRELTN